MLRISGNAKLVAGCGLAAMLLAAAPAAGAKTFTTLYAFSGGSDGAIAFGPVIADAAGDLYGTTAYGGASTNCGNRACGTVFKIAPDGNETVLYSFDGRRDGSHPIAGLIMDGKGNLYGTTQNGGGGRSCNLGCGTVFKVAPDGTETVLHAFTGGNDGSLPVAGLIKDASGNFYGTTVWGGGSGCNLDGCGTVFKVTRHGTETILYAFSGEPDGRNPTYGSLLRDMGGNLYGTTAAGGGGTCSNVCGTVFKLTPGGVESVLHAFSGGSDGYEPEGGLIADADGNLYGTTSEGGGGAGCNGDGCGTVFKLAPEGSKTILHVFAGGDSDGSAPTGNLLSKSGHFFGTTQAGGTANFGTVYRLTPTGGFVLLHVFTGHDDGDRPYAGLLGGPSGSLFGTATTGGTGDCGGLGCGTVFRLQ